MSSQVFLIKGRKRDILYTQRGQGNVKMETTIRVRLQWFNHKPKKADSQQKIKIENKYITNSVYSLEKIVILLIYLSYVEQW